MFGHIYNHINWNESDLRQTPFFHFAQQHVVFFCKGVSINFVVIQELFSKFFQFRPCFVFLATFIVLIRRICQCGT